jgi:hypothetical protein
MGQVVRYDVGNVFDPAFTMICRIDKLWLSKREGHGSRTGAASAAPQSMARPSNSI